MIVWLMKYVAILPLRFPRAVIACCAAITILACLFLPNLHVSTDRNLLSGTDNPEFQRREEMNNLFGTSLVAVAIIKGTDDRDEVLRAADQVAAELKTHPKVIKDVFFKADLSFFEGHALLFLPVENSKLLPQALKQSSEALGVVSSADDLPGLVVGLSELFDTIEAPENTDPEQTAAVFSFFGDLFDELGAWFANPEQKQLKLPDKLWEAAPALSSRPGYGGYLTDKDGKNPPLAVLFIQPTDSSQAMEVVEPLTDLIREKLAMVVKKHPGLTYEVTGMPAMATDELRLVQRDSVVAGIASGLGVLLVFILAFRSIRVSIFLVLPLGVGLIWSAGLTAVLYGHLTMITSYFAAVLFGIGVAFTIHIIARFHEALRNGSPVPEAIELSINSAGPGVVVGGGTTVLAFLAIAFCDFKGFAEMGVIAGAGVALILVANLTLLPAALLLWHPGLKIVRKQNAGGAFWTSIARSRIIVPLVSVIAMIGGMVFASRINFDYAVESLLPAVAESVKGMRTLDSRTEFSTNYSIAVAGSLKEVEQMRRQFEKLPTVARAEALSMFVPPNQNERIKVLQTVSKDILNQIAQTLESIKAKRKIIGKVKAVDLADSMEEFADALEDMAFDAKKAGRPESVGLTALVKHVRQAQKKVAKGSDERAQELEKMIFEGLIKVVDILHRSLADTGFGPMDLPETIRGRYLGSDNKSYAVIIFPDGDIGQIDFFEKHVAELLSVSKETTGHPVTHLTFTKMVHDGFRDAVILSLIAVVFLILLDLRSPKSLALALLPVVMGGGWTALAMVVFDVKFNYANLMALPILIGTGVDYGVHLAHRAKQEHSIWEAARTTGRAIALTGLTTLIGFGSLLLGNHWGVQSLGLVLVMGIFACLLAALVVIPGMVRKKEDKLKE